MTQKPLRYDHKVIEKKWQAYWSEHKTFKTESISKKPKYYVLDMFPYPSGSGLHVGHPVGYTATDIVARFKRLKGFNVLHPMGWDSFGLPAEQYAIRTGTHPAETTQKNIDNFRRQLQALGFSYDWDRELATSEATYYKWTQWIFTKLYERGLAYEAEASVNYCPALGTVLANEEVEDGKSKEGGFPIVRKPLKQWVLKITAYADRLLKDLDLLDWPEGLKKLQVNWIGRSEGAQVEFVEPSTNERISIFTTNPETLFGCTYLTLAPEHPLVKQITTPSQQTEMEAYLAQAASKSDLDRTDLAKDKSGCFTGAYAINPVSKEQLPIWVADYVLMNYGTGAVMGVPLHDDRDFEFAKKFSLPSVAVIDPQDAVSCEERQKILEGELCWTGEGVLCNSTAGELSLDGLDRQEARKKITAWLESSGLGKATVHYKLRDWLFSRQRYWGEPIPILTFEDGSKRMLGLDELPLMPPQVEDYKPSGDGQSPLAKAKDWVETIDGKTGLPARRQTHTMPQWAGSCWYYLRFCDPHNDLQAWDPEIEKYWMPVDLYVGGAEHAVLHLLYSRFWHKVLYDCGLVSTLEPFQSLRNQGLIAANSYKDANGLYVDVEQVQEKNGRFFHKNSGDQLEMQVEKMSKSKLNGVSPDEIIEEFGADALRLYEMFMGPLDKEKIWNTDAVSGCKRFLNRFFDMAMSEKVCDEESKEANRLGHRLIHGVEKDVEALQFNTAIAKMMEFINDFTKLDKYPKNVLQMAIQALSPFAPHVAEELWEALQGAGELSYHPWPLVDLNYLHEERMTYVVQVNGKVRGRMEMDRDLSQEQVLAVAQADAMVARYLDGKEVQKLVFVPNRLLNIVVGER